jgi:hypothetical protein
MEPIEKKKENQQLLILNKQKICELVKKINHHIKTCRTHNHSSSLIMHNKASNKPHNKFEQLLTPLF